MPEQRSSMTTSWSMSRVFTAGLPQCETPGRAVESSEWTVASSFGGRLSRRASARCELRGGSVSLRMPTVAIADLSCDAAKGALRETLAHRFDGRRFLGRGNRNGRARTDRVQRGIVSAQKKSRGRGAPGRTAASRQAILLEAIQEQNRATIEAIFASKQELVQRMDEMRRELTLRLEVVEAIVKKNSEGILQNTEGIRKNSEDIRKNSEQIRLNTEELGRHSEELRRIAAMLEKKSDQASLIALEKRVTALEKHVGL